MEVSLALLPMFPAIPAPADWADLSRLALTRNMTAWHCGHHYLLVIASWTSIPNILECHACTYAYYWSRGGTLRRTISVLDATADLGSSSLMKELPRSACEVFALAGIWLCPRRRGMRLLNHNATSAPAWFQYHWSVGSQRCGNQKEVLAGLLHLESVFWAERHSAC